MFITICYKSIHSSSRCTSQATPHVQFFHDRVTKREHMFLDIFVGLHLPAIQFLFMKFSLNILIINFLLSQWASSVKQSIPFKTHNVCYVREISFFRYSDLSIPDNTISIQKTIMSVVSRFSHIPSSMT